MLFFLARQGVVAALFIIFLGIVPFIAIIVLLSYYARQNFRFGWKKSSATTYVTNCFQHAVSACRGVGTRFKKSTASSAPHNKQHTTMSNIEIKQTGLISTTNTDCILRSKTITRKSDIDAGENNDSNSKAWRLSLKKFKRLSLKTDIKTDVESPATAQTLCDDDETPQVSVKNLTRQFDFSKAIPSSKI